jgi:hypothetical protein
MCGVPISLLTLVQKVITIDIGSVFVFWEIRWFEGIGGFRCYMKILKIKTRGIIHFSYIPI